MVMVASSLIVTGVVGADSLAGGKLALGSFLMDAPEEGTYMTVSEEGFRLLLSVLLVVVILAIFSLT